MAGARRGRAPRARVSRGRPEPWQAQMPRSGRARAAEFRRPVQRIAEGKQDLKSSLRVAAGRALHRREGDPIQSSRFFEPSDRNASAPARRAYSTGFWSAIVSRSDSKKWWANSARRLAGTSLARSPARPPRVDGGASDPGDSSSYSVSRTRSAKRYRPADRPPPASSPSRTASSIASPSGVSSPWAIAGDRPDVELGAHDRTDRQHRPRRGARVGQAGGDHRAHAGGTATIRDGPLASSPRRPSAERSRSAS